MTKYDNLPQLLKENAQFCCWRFEEVMARITKVPYDPITGGRASTNKPETFCDYEIALRSVKNYNGLGFRIANRICALDLDKCFNTDGTLKLWAKDIVDLFSNCYMERSPSGEGLRILFLMPASYIYNKAKYYINNRTLGLEVYVAGATNRFVTVTGNVFQQGDLIEMSGALDKMLEKYMTRSVSAKTKTTTTLSCSYLSDESVIIKASASVNCDKFSALWNGDISSYASHSEADLALASSLAFFCGGDIDQMDRLFRQSGLIREKWDRPQSGSTYGRLTLEKAAASKTEFYTPSSKRATAKEDFSLLSVNSLHPESNEMYPWTDIGNGRLFADIMKDKARFVPERKLWYVYDGKHWCPDICNLKVMVLCKQIADMLISYALSIDDERQRSAYLDHSRKWQLRRNRETILKDAQDSYPISMEEFDSDPYIFNCSNGTFHLKTMEFKPHKSEDKLTKISNVNYDPVARCERFAAYIDEIMSGDYDKAQFLQKTLGYAISGDTRYECLFFLYGSSTRNGKGTLMESVLKVMGNYGRTVRPETISLKQYANSQNPTEDIARLAGIRFANISEPSRGLVLNAAQVKSMTGNDTLNARYLHENSFDFQPQFKIYVNTNYLPVITDMTLFSSGRVVIIPFDKHFTEEEQDKTLKREFAKAKNQSAILNWLIEGYTLLGANDFTQPLAVKAATESYRHDSDKISLFIEDALEKSPNKEVRTADVYYRYQRWCSNNGSYAENMRNFKQALSAVAHIEHKRPRGGGGATTLLIGYKLSNDDGIYPI